MPEDTGRTPEWEQIVARFARFSGVVGEVHDPLTWGLDLVDEEITGAADPGDPTEERFVRGYRSVAGEALEVETLRVAAPHDQVDDIVRAACSGALAAPLHADIDPDSADLPPDPIDFAEAYQDYRTAMRAIVAEVDEVPSVAVDFLVDGHTCAGTAVTVRDVAAIYAPAADRALVVTGPAGLVDRIDVVTRPIRNLKHGDDGPHF
ncbi:hypothetical protein [Myceligenerans indicum]|uniref:Uncharacterized protein n=1 Tax=Myceligenerans indicum TaxID=2593663 RepID=A0ABS1LNT5_9MICO|nr:hypothetical protein [Myceligenerans indicum]MBL0887207.1 hypothetical protein [Myceligenerans indicum]